MTAPESELRGPGLQRQTRGTSPGPGLGLPVLSICPRVPVTGRGPAAALATDGRVYAAVGEVDVPDEAGPLLEALEAVLGPSVFIGVPVRALTARALLLFGARQE